MNMEIRCGTEKSSLSFASPPVIGFRHFSHSATHHRPALAARHSAPSLPASAAPHWILQYSVLEFVTVSPRFINLIRLALRTGRRLGEAGWEEGRLADWEKRAAGGTNEPDARRQLEPLLDVAKPRLACLQAAHTSYSASGPADAEI
ncbi:hypothetical protein E2C01_026755 [Portunus trituberculatus]|uniref:Uncharacterized protein n=1 Tax=Portunus trituberculatus TaxID=210409 RepID=A0A5B7EJH8_PORTR|nr:hypothetical protein [Portunus trituberculatus]